MIMGIFSTGLIALIVILVIWILSGLVVVQQYERGIILTLGRYSNTKEPGLKWIFRGFQKMIKVDIRVRTIDIPRQEVITSDNVTVGINAVVFVRVERAEDAILKVQDYVYAIAQYALGALRDVIGGVELDVLLTQREKIAEDIKKIVDQATDPWGIDVPEIKIQDIELPAEMKRAMAKQAEAERERRAVIIRAEGELKASENLSVAGEKLASTPGGLTLRTLKTIEQINPDPSKTVIFALPIEILEAIKRIGVK